MCRKAVAGSQRPQRREWNELTSMRENERAWVGQAGQRRPSSGACSWTVSLLMGLQKAPSPEAGAGKSGHVGEAVTSHQFSFLFSLMLRWAPTWQHQAFHWDSARRSQVLQSGGDSDWQSVMNTDMYLVPGTHDCFWVGSSAPRHRCLGGWEMSTPAASDSAPT